MKAGPGTDFHPLEWESGRLRMIIENNDRALAAARKTGDSDRMPTVAENYRRSIAEAALITIRAIGRAMARKDNGA